MPADSLASIIPSDVILSSFVIGGCVIQWGEVDTAAGWRGARSPKQAENSSIIPPVSVISRGVRFVRRASQSPATEPLHTYTDRHRKILREREKYELKKGDKNKERE